ncbi:sulfhydryl oxidase 1-like protein [Leptotrombidium deliense]|uniref:Sulfhydryl oxidase 1-like protein n=1 Tax=Leptotrombidium deliense TaxID=299467 RepID=A0A443RYD8_9ACAR|nr:sulfhydryl oxidase 1-like protein [Leptotrombidium deliense]
MFIFTFKSFRAEANYPVALTAHNFSSYVYESESATLVEFYSTYCGFCLRLAPRLKHFAESVTKWKSVVKVAKVNCEEMENLILCRKHKRLSFPTFLFFAPDLLEGESGVLIQCE